MSVDGLTPKLRTWDLAGTIEFYRVCQASGVRLARATRTLSPVDDEEEQLPRKLRELIRDLERAGFVDRGGRGSHRNFTHPDVRKPVTLSGNPVTMPYVIRREWYASRLRSPKR